MIPPRVDNTSSLRVVGYCSVRAPSSPLRWVAIGPLTFGMRARAIKGPRRENELRVLRFFNRVARCRAKCSKHVGA
eukprot:1179111-Prorocentrum_minimum.AAC.2